MDKATRSDLLMEAYGLDAMMAAYEKSYLRLLEEGGGEADERNRAVAMFYAMQNVAERIVEKIEMMGA